MAVRALQDSAAVREAVERAYKNLQNPLIDKGRVNVLNYYSSMTEYMTAAESGNDRLANTAQRNMRGILNGRKTEIEGDIYFSAAKEAVLEFLRQGSSKAHDLFGVLKASDAEYRITANIGACKKCAEREGGGKLAEIDKSMLPPYHPNCKCKLEIYDSGGDIIDVIGNTSYKDTVSGNSEKSNSGNTPWYGSGIRELTGDPLGTIKKHGINLLEEIPLTNYLEATFGYDLYDNRLNYDERLDKVGTALQQGMDALISTYMAGGINVVGGSGMGNFKPFIKHEVYNDVRNKLGKDAADKFIDAMNKGLVNKSGENGIKLLGGQGIKIGNTYYKYEIKIKGKFGDYRIFGNFNNYLNQIIFDKFSRGVH